MIQASNVALDAISCVIIGTTHFVNAVVQRSASLQRVGVVRLCGGSKDGFGLGVPPFVDFPPDLRRLIHGRSFFCEGGHQISGGEISSLDEDELERVAEELVKEAISDVVIAGIYSPLNPEHELKAERILMQKMAQVCSISSDVTLPRVTLSHQISSIGFLARENAAILNASLRPLAESTIFGFQKAMQDIFGETPCALYLTQNDGSVMTAPDAINLPIRTFNSGPTNSIRGGEFLWKAANKFEAEANQGRQDALVVIDIGGTTSDSGLLLPSGLPRMSSVMNLVGGVRTNFALPAVESVALGGGSAVRISEDDVTIGPDSVALNLRQSAWIFGGDTLTATDIAVASERHRPSQVNPFKELGDPSRIKNLPIDIVRLAKDKMRRTIEELVDRTKVHKGDVDVLIVGGGAILINVDVDEPLMGVRAVRKVSGGEVANAVGAAISRVSGVVDTVVDTAHQTIKEAQATACNMAVDAAVINGAVRDTVEIVEVTVLPIQYVEAKARMLVRAVGLLDVVRKIGVTMSPRARQQPRSQAPGVAGARLEPIQLLDPALYEPKIEGFQWVVSLTDVEWISAGCKVLGCGGGGDPYENYLKIKLILEMSPGNVRIVSPTSLSADAKVGWTGCMGSPEVSSERMEASECSKAHDELTRIMGISPVDAFMAVEIGGGNGLVNLEVAAEHNVPCVDADFMGRAYPTDWQTTVNVYGSAKGEALVPATVASGDGSFMTLTASRTDRLVDSILRAVTVETGCRAGKAGPPKSAKVVQEQAILNTVSLAWWIGRAMAMEKNIMDKATHIIEAVGGIETAQILAEGKITSVERVLKAGHTYGVVEIDGTLSSGTKATIRIPFKNENAFVEATPTAKGKKCILASVPDLIAVLDSETGSGLGTPEYKYGLKVTIIAIAASPRWTDTKRGLALGGPSSMGFDSIEYVPIGKYSVPRSVISAYS